jgi:hypothetical protein
MLTLAGPILDWHPFANLDKHFQHLSCKPNLLNFSVHPELIKTISTSKQTAVLNHALYHKIIKHDELTMFTPELENVLFFSMKRLSSQNTEQVFFSILQFKSTSESNCSNMIWTRLLVSKNKSYNSLMYACMKLWCATHGLLWLIIGLCDTQSIWEVSFMVPVKTIVLRVRFFLQVL